VTRPAVVLHVHAGNRYGGIETALVTLARHRKATPLVAHHFALCFHDRLARELEAAGAAVSLLGPARVSRPWSVFRARQRLGALLAELEPDVVVHHAPWSQALFAPVARARDRRVAFWLHGAVTGQHWLEHWAAGTPPSLAICNSRFTAATLPAMYPTVTPVVVHVPVAPPEIDDVHATRRRVRAQLGARDAECVILQVGRMEAGKGYDVHLQALATLSGLDWTCWMVGDAVTPRERAYRHELAQTARRLAIADRVRFLGPRSDVANLLAAADLYCQPNTAPEGFGVTLVEALYAGVPVVTSAMGGALEIVTEGCGALVPPGAVRHLSGALRRLIESPTHRDALRAAGPARARGLCDPEQTVRRLAAVLFPGGG